ncbi:hypothetical protein ACP70R_021079 [Stipagrostis hirtigluma subsp. patula]
MVGCPCRHRCCGDGRRDGQIHGGGGRIDDWAVLALPFFPPQAALPLYARRRHRACDSNRGAACGAAREPRPTASRRRLGHATRGNTSAGGQTSYRASTSSPRPPASCPELLLQQFLTPSRK